MGPLPDRLVHSLSHGQALRSPVPKKPFSKQELKKAPNFESK